MAIVLVATLPPLAPILQSRLPGHLLVQYPLIVAGGALVGARLARGHARPWTAAPALLAAVLSVAYWLLPRWIDTSLADPITGLAKVVTLAAFAGLPLGWGWVQAGPVLRGFLVANVAAMLAVMGWLQLVVPARLCNAYLLSDQRLLGIGFLSVVAILAAILLARALTGRRA